jgi:CRP/FNR family transcriptional regulator, cyclic AMP receptor protein
MKLSRSEIESGQRVLRSSGWLSQCEEPFRAAILAESQWFRVDQAYHIARGGDETGGMYGVADGYVGLVPAIATPDAGLIHVDRAPFWFGLQPFVLGTGRQVTVVARTSCIVAHVSQQELTAILKRHPEGWRMLLMQCVVQTGVAVQSMADLLLADRHRRFGAVLLRLAGARNPGSAVHPVQCSHEELAEMCNLSRSSIASVLRVFEKEGLVEVAYRSIKIRDPDRLRLMVDAC